MSKPKKDIIKSKPRKISNAWFWLIYSLPLALIIVLFPFQNPVFLNNPYPFGASFSGTTIMFRIGFSEIPATILAYSNPPLLSAIGIPKDLFTYRKCFYHKSFFKSIIVRLIVMLFLWM